jgi:hypothetical protein
MKDCDSLVEEERKVERGQRCKARRGCQDDDGELMEILCLNTAGRPCITSCLVLDADSRRDLKRGETRLTQPSASFKPQTSIWQRGDNA